MPEIHPTEIFHQLLADRSKHLEELRAELAKAKCPVVLENLHGSALPFILSQLLSEERRPLLILTAGGERAEDITGDLEYFGVETAFHYPKWEVLPYDEDDLTLEIAAKTLDVLEGIVRRADDREAPAFAVCAPVDALMLRVLPQATIKQMNVRIRWGETIDPAEFADTLNRAGYTREPLVEARGEYSIRGGIIDIYPLNREDPIRIDLFGDEIESVRNFDPVTQRSTDDLGTEADIIIPPTRLKQQVMNHLSEGVALDSLFDLMPEDTIIVLETPERYHEVCGYFENAVARQYEMVIKENPDAVPPEKLLISAAELPKQIGRFQRIEHSDHPAEPDGKSKHISFEQVNYGAESAELDAWISQIEKLQKKDYLLAVICDNDGQVQRFDELLREREISAVPVIENQAPTGFHIKDVLEGYQDIIVTTGALQSGFAMPDIRLCLITDREIFGRYKRRYVYKKIYKGKPIQSSNEMRRNDFVVHADHGIGQFLGMRVQNIDNRMVELIEILYDNNDKLLVPVEKIHKVQKYSGPESAEPKLDRLGSAKWAKRRKKNTEEIEKMAEALLELYAERQMANRDPHGGDTRLQKEFESSFLYQETPDQMQAIIDAKTDMERDRPMDRLVCGDVGYGKTEVAIRAVFKCVQSGRQAAILCPTTILAQQHFNTFRERFADYPIRIDKISRFRKPAEVKEIKKKMKEGALDVVIGTHALLSKDVSFQNLGLMVVDEEQRFGVKAKEKLKDLRKEVDILTLSATPIPRTLHLALSGMRDLSLITTPPPDRQPIKTKIINFEEDQISEAILRELNRGGQVYFIHNRVNTIKEVAKRLQEIVPHAKIAIGHGQMKQGELEDVMMDFINQKYDILVATTIVESGVDIPNCNTIIINRADAFGLAQLYQLRGRVGRERRRAYAYLIVPQGRAITDAAVKRLQAIEEFAELGVGFSIAMRDLEIRGAGDVLGKQQHGAISEIGFELFCELLEEKVREKSGDLPPKFQDVEVRWDASALIPPPYMPMEAQRVTFYKRCADARSEEDLKAIADELEDRFGRLPVEAETMLDTYRLRICAQPLRIGGIVKSGNKIRITLIEPEARERESVFKRAAKGIPEIESLYADTFDQVLITAKEKLEQDVIAKALLEWMKKTAAEAPSASIQQEA